MENVGKIALADITLVEDPNEDEGRPTDDEGKWYSLNNVKVLSMQFIMDTL